MATLTKSHMTARVASKLQGSMPQGRAALNAVLDSIQEAVRTGDRVVITRFGSFEVRPIKASKIRLSFKGQAGELMTVPAHNRVGFKTRISPVVKIGLQAHGAGPRGF